LAATAFLVAMSFSTIPTPLYVLYQQRDDFSSFVVMVVFAVYAAGVVASLLLAGHVSDWVGRRRILTSALAIEASAAVLFLVWPGLAGLIVARFVSGIGIGMITSTATAALRDLHALDRPAAGAARFEVVSTAANLGGLGVGTLVSGALTQAVGAPLVVPYAVFAGLLLLAMVGLCCVPETVRPPAVRPPYRPQRLTFGQGDRATAVMAGASAFVGFAVFGLFTSLAPGFVGTSLHHPSRLLAGVVPFVAFGAAAVAQMAAGRLTDRSRMLTGIVVEAVGVVVVAVSMEAANLAAFLVGGGLAGAGAGVLFKSALAVYVGTAQPARRGEAASSLFLFAYLGLIIPVLGIGVSTLYLSAPSAMLLFSGALLVILGAIGAMALRRPSGVSASATMLRSGRRFS
jgi:MFS family permease